MINHNIQSVTIDQTLCDVVSGWQGMTFKTISDCSYLQTLFKSLSCTLSWNARRRHRSLIQKGKLALSGFLIKHVLLDMQVARFETKYLRFKMNYTDFNVIITVSIITK